MDSMETLASRWSSLTADRPTLSLLKGGKGGGTSKKKRTDDDDDDDDEEEEEEEEEDPDDDDDEEEDSDELADMDEDELREELRKAQERLSRSSSSNAGKRKRIARLRRELNEAKGAPPAKPKAKAKGDDDDEEVDVEAIKTNAKVEATTAANARIVKAEARGALKAAGIPKDQVGRLVGMLKLDDIDVDDDGEVDEDALEEAIDELKKDWPQLFGKSATTRKRRRVAGDSDAGGGQGPQKRYSATELQVAAALGKKPSQLSSKK